MSSPKNMAASVKNRLLTLSKDRQEVFHHTLVRYGMERLLYRIGVSEHANDLVLKGAALFFVWDPQLRHRPTRDIDLLSFGSPDMERLRGLFEALCKADVPDDGLRFEPDGLIVSRIKEGMEYEGVRVVLKAFIERAAIPLSVDVAFGDAITPDARLGDYPTLLDLSSVPPPRLRIYPRETVVAEKLQAMVHLGMANSRLKDFFDVLFLAEHFSFEGALLVRAIQRTFERRRTPLPEELPIALTTDFSKDHGKVRQWNTFLARNKLEARDLDAVVTALKDFLWPAIQASHAQNGWALVWPALGPWMSEEGTHPLPLP